jgi:hypothetical protein
MSAPDLTALARDAYVDGFPLAFNLEQIQRFTEEGLGSLPPAPFNSFSHARALAGPGDTFVSINNDTVYSSGPLDLTAGPLRLDVPDAGGRYYVLQFIDAWTNNFAYVGRRATGTGAAGFWIVPPGWTGELAGDLPVIHAPTALAMIVGRWAVDGEADLPAVHALQDGVRLTALDDAPPAGLPRPDPSVPEELRFFEQVRVYARRRRPSRSTARASARWACSTRPRRTPGPRTSWRAHCAQGWPPARSASSTPRRSPAPRCRTAGS